MLCFLCRTIWSSVNPVWKNMSQVLKITIKQIVPAMFQYFLKTLEFHLAAWITLQQFLNLSNFCGLGIFSVGGLLTPRCNTDARYIKAVIVFQWFFVNPTQRAGLYYFRRTYHTQYRMWFLSCRHDLFALQKLRACVDNTFLVPNESHMSCANHMGTWRSLKSI